MGACSISAVEVPLVGGAEHGGQNLLGGRAERGAIAAAAQLARDHGRPEGMLGPPVGRVDRRVEQATEDRLKLGEEMRGEPLDRGRPTGRLEKRVQATDYSRERRPPLRLSVPWCGAVTQREHVLQRGCICTGKRARG